MEYIGFAGLGAAIATAVLLMIQIRNNSKVISADFAQKYIDSILNDCKKTVEALHDRNNGKNVKLDEHKVIVLLNRLENIIFYINDRVIKKKYALMMLDITLRLLKNDKRVLEIIANKRKEKHQKNAFIVIEKFMKNEV